MKLDDRMNYIVSGLERSGTSLLMQILNAGGVPMAFDTESRPPDDNNPRGYFELEGGKIISALMKGTFPMENYRGRFIKITAYGLKFIPEGRYKIIYSLRDLEEILDSMEKMARLQDDNRAETREAFTRLNDMIRSLITRREDIEVLFVDYNRLVKDPQTHVREIHGFIGAPEADLEKMVASVDRKLYRNRRV